MLAVNVNSWIADTNKVRRDWEDPTVETRGTPYGFGGKSWGVDFA